MATYKVIQDIEAEDKLLGPLTLRQFVYAAIVIVVGFIDFKLAQVNFLLALPLLPGIFFFGLLAAPFGHDQSSEVWLLAKIRFMLKPRKRIWDQSGLQQLVTITVPKKPEHQLTNGLTDVEVKSRLQALANTLDSRGWAVKNVNVNATLPALGVVSDDTSDDRLLSINDAPQDVPNTDVTAADDILDETSNPTAQHLDAMISQSTQARREALIATASGQTAASEQPMSLQTPPQISSTDEQALLERLHKEQSQPNPAYGHMKTLQPLHGTKSGAPSTEPKKAPSGNSGLKTQNSGLPNSDILRLANNDD